MVDAPRSTEYGSRYSAHTMGVSVCRPTSGDWVAPGVGGYTPRSIVSMAGDASATGTTTTAEWCVGDVCCGGGVSFRVCGVCGGTWRVCMLYRGHVWNVA